MLYIIANLKCRGAVEPLNLPMYTGLVSTVRTPVGHSICPRSPTAYTSVYRDRSGVVFRTAYTNGFRVRKPNFHARVRNMTRTNSSDVYAGTVRMPFKMRPRARHRDLLERRVSPNFVG